MADTPSAAFYQAVLVVIPALFFGGVLVGAVPQPNRQEKTSSWRADALLVAVVVLPIMLEVQALRGVLGAKPGGFWVALSAAYILGATAVVGVALLRPWHYQLGPTRWVRASRLIIAAVVPVVMFAWQFPDTVRIYQQSSDLKASLALVQEDADLIAVANADRLRVALERVRVDYLRGRVTKARYLRDRARLLRSLSEVTTERRDALTERLLGRLEQ